jgi:hypothetical protein
LAISLPPTAARRTGWRTRAIYGHGVSHINQQVFLLRLAPPDSTDGLPRPLGYTKDTDHGDIYVIENYE